MYKSELRKEFKRRRQSLTATELSAASQRIAARFFEEIDLSEVRTLHTFIRIPKFNEVDTSNIYFRIWQQLRGIATFAPRCDAETGELTSIEFDAETPLVENGWNVREPASGNTAEPEELDIILVPLLCFDLFGHRVGYGKGFYDSFLSRCRGDSLKVGLSGFPPVEMIRDVSEKDVPLDICITPARTYRFGPPN
ncbi:5-formyltetrahydrofolate cyclo-ligase [Leptolyngbya sp. 7M]|uniref:5-formyltetrahydrofolate cyclo-ligase n=1 Tax=Leptolyngbya sp. 7M TaxID=2812896 RepID=UPI001B8CC3BA|nr:5-formyltetrahydrofolate cyclo-ligase [Leptolyngbya sp. 7M]QYO66004.1 5-formyltetrahydrofolate cyclo-ligase [Leptolyngbya sp. 7M]